MVKAAASEAYVPLTDASRDLGALGIAERSGVFTLELIAWESAAAVTLSPAVTNLNLTRSDSLLEHKTHPVDFALLFDLFLRTCTSTGTLPGLGDGRCALPRSQISLLLFHT